MVLVPNLRYATQAFEAGAHAITIPVSVSEPHSVANIRKTHPEIIAEVRAIVALRNQRFPAIAVETSLSTAFGCTIQGVVPEDDVIRMEAVQDVRLGEGFASQETLLTKSPSHPPFPRWDCELPSPERGEGTATAARFAAASAMFALGWETACIPINRFL